MHHIRRTQSPWDQHQEVSPKMKSIPRWPRSPLTQWSFRRYGTWKHGSDPHPNEGLRNADHPRETHHPNPFQETVQKEDQIHEGHWTHRGTLPMGECMGWIYNMVIMMKVQMRYTSTLIQSV